MATWVGAITETGGRADFWTTAARHGIASVTSDTPTYALFDFDIDFEASFRVAEAMSRDLETMALGFAAQTVVDVYELRAFSKGTLLRRLGYSRDDGGWGEVEGTPQPWEPAFFFDDNMLWDDVSDEDVARYESARRAKDASAVLDLIHPSSTEPLHRLCGFFDVRAGQPHGRWQKPSLLSRLFRRRDGGSK